MFDLEDGIIIGSERVPWLMWIQLLILLLLLILIYHIFAFSLGLDIAPASAFPSPEIISSSSAVATATPTSSRLHAPKVRGSQSVENATGTSTSRRRGKKEDAHDKEGDSSHFNLSERSYHPCHYLGLARQAFLKCLGLDITSKDSPTDTRQRKDQ